MGFLETIGNIIADKLVPVVADTITVEIEKRIPMLVEACVVAITKTMGELAVNGIDQITNAIPGRLDDDVIDPLARNILNEIKKRFHI